MLSEPFAAPTFQAPVTIPLATLAAILGELARYPQLVAAQQGEIERQQREIERLGALVSQFEPKVNAVVTHA